MSRVPHSLITAAIGDYSKGLPWKELRRKYDVSPTTLLSRMKQMGIPLRVNLDEFKQLRLSGMKRCGGKRGCGAVFPISEFSRSGSKATTYCKGCWGKFNRKYYKTEQGQRGWRSVIYRNKYGITVEDYDRMLASQDGHCALCPTVTGMGQKTRLHVDHCHNTGKIRGLLCFDCNTGLGKFKDKIDLIEKAFCYLKVNNEN